ncbi:MAG: Proline dehydrogenase [Fimbriimonadaceae bacterium]|nr:Proline dehydrogenase [Fimbriimonadaceae bacterium]
MISRTLVLRTAALPPVERLVRRSRLFRPLVRRFIAGDTLEEAMTAAERLVASGLKVSLDLLGENVSSLSEAERAKSTYIEMLHRIAKSPNRDQINISIKLTQCGLDLGDDVAENKYREVLDAAAASDTFVRVDMESSDYTERTIQLIERVWPDFKNTGTVLQSYLHRTPEDLERLIALGVRIRLVKGAYLEPERVAYPKKADVDAAYIRLGQRLLEAGHYPAFATQDPKMIEPLKAWATSNGIGSERFEWQMLYGIRRDLQDGLKDEGYNVRVYVPFGESWYPYFTRRLAERPANAFFILKSLFKG